MHAGIWVTLADATPRRTASWDQAPLMPSLRDARSCSAAASDAGVRAGVTTLPCRAHMHASGRCVLEQSLSVSTHA